MIFETLFAREVYIRLAEDKSGFVCTVGLGPFISKSVEFALKGGSALSRKLTEELLSTRALRRKSPTLPRPSGLSMPAD